MWRHVRTDVSEELIASIIRVERISELGAMLAVTSNRPRYTNYVLSKRGFLQVPHYITSQKTAFCLSWRPVWLFCILCVRFRLARYCKYLHIHDSVRLWPAACIISLYNVKRTDMGKPCANPELVWTFKNRQWFGKTCSTIAVLAKHKSSRG
jgi:hypothetical protein